GETAALLGPQPPATEGVIVFGLGPRDRFDAGAAYAAGAAVAKRLAGKPREALAVVLPEGGDPSAVASALVEGLIVGTRGPGLRKSEPARHPFGRLELVVPPDHPAGAIDPGPAVARGDVVGRAINLARDLANTPPSEKSPRQLAARAAAEAEAAGVGVAVWD